LTGDDGIIRSPKSAVTPQREHSVAVVETPEATVNNSASAANAPVADTSVANTPVAADKAVVDASADQNCLEEILRDTALFVEKSQLKTVAPDYIYSLLPRQSEPKSYKFVKEGEASIYIYTRLYTSLVLIYNLFIH
jgi:hypothetical protein